MSRKQKLELTWLGKESRHRLEPRILLANAAESYHAPQRMSDRDIFENSLIHGDNLLALKALEADFTGKIRCVYVDPPFNTQQAFEHYDDGVEHSLWLTLMRDRLEVIHRLMATDGSLFVHIDDNELGYLVVLLDEIFGRRNRINVVTFKQSSASGPKATNPGLVTTNNYILYYAKDKARWSPNRVFVATNRDDRYTKVIENVGDEFSRWRLIGLRDAFLQDNGLKAWADAKQRFSDRLEERITAFVLSNAHRVVRTARVAEKDVNESAREALARSNHDRSQVFRSTRSDKDDYYFLAGEQLIFYKTKTKVVDRALSTSAPLTNLWDDLLSNNLHNEGGVTFPNGKKPEALIKRCLELSTNPGDIVLDSFAGSGTTGAVAHKMGRRWIMVELGDHCRTHIVPRLRRVIDGTDSSGVTEAVGWKGGGGYRFYQLAPSLLEKDKWGNWVVNKQYDGAMLAAAVCKLEGFSYAPSETIWWEHGFSSEHDFIYVTTQSLGADQLRALSDDVGTGKSLLVCCSAFRCNVDRFDNLTVKKIPKAVLAKCEWGRDDYSLNVSSLPVAPPEPMVAVRDQSGPGERRRAFAAQTELFAADKT